MTTTTEPGLDSDRKWLAEQLKVPAELRLIGSVVQVVPDEHGSEMWGNFPLERKRLFKLFRSFVHLPGPREHQSEIVVRLAVARLELH